MDPEADVTARAEDKAIYTKRLALEAGADTSVRVKAKAEVRYQYLGILMVVLSKVKDESNVLKREMVGSKEDTKEKLEMSRAEVEA